MSVFPTTLSLRSCYNPAAVNDAELASWKLMLLKVLNCALFFFYQLVPHMLRGLASFSHLQRPLTGLSFPPSHCPSKLPSYLLFLLFLVLLCEEGVDPPDLGEHAAICQAEAEAEEPQAELEGRGREG